MNMILPKNMITDSGAGYQMTGSRQYTIAKYLRVSAEDKDIRNSRIAFL